MNKVSLIGRTTKDIELRTVANGLSVAQFTLAVNRRKKGEADFISCKAFGKNAENLNMYVNKGDRLGVVGHIQTGSYEKDGKKNYTTDIIVDEFDFLEKKKDNNGFVDTDDVPDWGN